MFKFILLIFISLNLFSKDITLGDEVWHLERSSFYFENDTYFNTDYDYTAGLKLSYLYHVKNPRKNIFDFSPLNFGGADTYRSFAMVHQMYTPKDIEEAALIENDRPYAGWTYFEIGLHKSSTTHLRTLNLKLGIIGPLSGAEQLQNFTHDTIGSPHINGWDNQINNELGINIKYTHKWRFIDSDNGGFESSLIPFTEIELGNVNIQTTAGFSMRIGHNIPKDFGVSSIDIGGDDGVPSYQENLISNKKDWSYSLNMHCAGSYVAKDIFLDGNTYTNSHSIEKKNIIGYYGFGFSIRYKRFIFDFIQTFNTKKFNSEDRGHDTGSIVLSWIYD